VIRVHWLPAFRPDGLVIILSIHYTPNELFRQVYMKAVSLQPSVLSHPLTAFILCCARQGMAVINGGMGWIAGETPGPCSCSKNARIFFKIDESTPNFFIFKEFHI
jgi:hypothetical protein